MISQREVEVLTEAIKKHAGLDVPRDAAVEALYALADYNLRVISPKREAPTYGIPLPQDGAADRPVT